MTVVGERLQPTLFERSRPGRGGDKIPHPPKDALDRIPAEARRANPPALPELNEPDVVRHVPMAHRPAGWHCQFRSWVFHLLCVDGVAH